jgi:S1-C subfamily serine protease
MAIHRRVIFALIVLLPLSAAGCSREKDAATTAATPAPTPMVDRTADLRRVVREEVEAALAERDAERPPTCTPALAVARARPSTVRVETHLPTTVIISGSGTGFVALAGGLVITAGHVIRPGHDILLTLADGRRVPATLVAADAGADLALLRAADPTLTPVLWADPSAVSLGEETVVIGYALGREEPVVTAGVLSRRVPAADNGGVALLETDANADPGNSGGPLLTRCGEALGVVVRIDRTTVFTTIAIGASTVLPFITRAAERR